MAISTSMSNLEHFTIITLVDITRTGITRNYAGEEHLRDQQRNWETVLQVLGIRAQPTVTDGPITDMVEEFVVKNLFENETFSTNSQEGIKQFIIKGEREEKLKKILD